MVATTRNIEEFKGRIFATINEKPNVLKTDILADFTEVLKEGHIICISGVCSSLSKSSE